MALPIQKLELVERRWEALLRGDKLDTIRYKEPKVSSGFLLYESFPSACQYSVVLITHIMDIPLREVLHYTQDTARKPNEQALLKRMKKHYPEITLDSTIQYVRHLSVDETARRYPTEVYDILTSAYEDLSLRPKHQIVFFSNPFGLGPSGKAFSVLNEAKKMFDCEWYFAGGQECSSIGDFNDVTYIELDERNLDEIRQLLNHLQRPFVVSSLNRFATSVASSMDIPNVLIDGLTWMWDPIPDELLHADIYFALRFANIEKVERQYPDIRIVDYITENLTLDPMESREGLLIHLGGMYNPLTQTVPLSYLAMLNEVLDSLGGEEEITVCGSRKAIEFLHSYSTNQKIDFVTFEKSVFNHKLARSKRFITTPGLTATMEAYSLQTPTAFLPPVNVSQWKVLSVLHQANTTPCIPYWDVLASGLEDIGQQSERDAIILLNQVADNIKHDSELHNKFIRYIASILDDDIPSEKQKEFMSTIGYRGTNQILQVLQEYWSLPVLSQRSTDE